MVIASAKVKLSWSLAPKKPQSLNVDKFSIYVERQYKSEMWFYETSTPNYSYTIDNLPLGKRVRIAIVVHGKDGRKQPRSKWKILDNLFDKIVTIPGNVTNLGITQNGSKIKLTWDELE